MLLAPNLSSEVNGLENKYEGIASRMNKFFDECKINEIELNRDCNYIQPCYYNSEELLEMFIGTPRKITFSCGNSSPVDIDSDGNAWRCYGMYSILRRNIKDFKNENELERYFTRRVKLLNNLLAYEECENCPVLAKGV